MLHASGLFAGFIVSSSPTATVEGAWRSPHGGLHVPFPTAAGFFLSHPQDFGVYVSRVDAHGVTKKASGMCERLAG